MYQVVNLFFSFLNYAIIIRVLLSWIPSIPRDSFLVRFLYDITDPILVPIQNVLNRVVNLGMIDISPIVAVFLLSLIRNMVLQFLL